MTLLLVLLAVVVVAALMLLACCVYAWNQPVRRCGLLQFDGVKQKKP